MPWLESIHLLTGPSGAADVARDLAATVTQIEKECVGCQVTVHTGQDYPADVLVCLHWQGTGPPEKSSAGLLLADHLRDLGLVDHSVWPQVLLAAAATGNGDGRRRSRQDGGRATTSRA